MSAPAKTRLSSVVLQKDPQAYVRYAHPATEPRGGFVVHRRGSSRGDLIGRVRPTEHSSLEAAKREASRLSALHNHEFVVFQEVFAVPPCSAAEKAA